MTIDQDILLEYVMGGLTPEAEREVASYLNQNPNEAAWTRDLFEVLAEVALAQPPAEVPEDAEALLLERIRSTGSAPNVIRLPRREPARTWWLGVAAAAATLLVAWLALFQFQPPPELQAERRLEQLCQDQAVTCQTLTDDAGEALGTLARQPGNELFVVLNEPPPAGQVYQAWEIVGEIPRSLGIFRERVLEVEEPLAAGSVFGLSLEPPGGSPQPTTTPIVVVPLAG